MLSQVWHRLRYGAEYLRLRAMDIEWLFVLGHMRSGSSLLVHLLNSNPDIMGYGETHTTYFGRRSLARLHSRVYNKFSVHGEDPKGYRYVMDKILHPHVRSEMLLKNAPLSIVIIVRSPVSALPSIMDLDLDWIQSDGDALEYYRRTLERVERWMKVYGRPYVLIEYCDLVEDTEATLKSLTGYLNLAEPLTPEYETMWSTGKKFLGDSSEEIEKGVVENKKSEYASKVRRSVIKKAEEKYRSFISSNKNFRRG